MSKFWTIYTYSKTRLIKIFCPTCKEPVSIRRSSFDVQSTISCSHSYETQHNILKRLNSDPQSFVSYPPGTSCFEITHQSPNTKEHFILEKIYISLIREYYLNVNKHLVDCLYSCFDISSKKLKFFDIVVQSTGSQCKKLDYVDINYFIGPKFQRKRCRYNGI